MKEIFLSELNYDYLLNFVAATFDNFNDEQLEVFDSIYENVSYYVDADDNEINQILTIVTCLINDLKKEGV